MAVQAGFSRVAALLADPAREAMLVALADGRALPAGELAKAAGITPQSASGHLRKMVEGGIVSVWSQGRSRYFRLANEQVGAALETLANVAQAEPRRIAAVWSLPANLRAARCCYTHIAGRLGVALADALVRCGYVASEGDCVELTDRGARWPRRPVFRRLHAGPTPVICENASTGPSGGSISQAACRAPSFDICSKPVVWNGATSDH